MTRRIGRYKKNFRRATTDLMAPVRVTGHDEDGMPDMQEYGAHRSYSGKGGGFLSPDGTCPPGYKAFKTPWQTVICEPRSQQVKPSGPPKIPNIGKKSPARKSAAAKGRTRLRRGSRRSVR